MLQLSILYDHGERYHLWIKKYILTKHSII